MSSCQPVAIFRITLPVLRTVNESIYLAITNYEIRFKDGPVSLLGLLITEESGFNDFFPGCPGGARALSKSDHYILRPLAVDTDLSATLTEVKEFILTNYHDPRITPQNPEAGNTAFVAVAWGDGPTICAMDCVEGEWIQSSEPSDSEGFIQLEYCWPESDDATRARILKIQLRETEAWFRIKWDGNRGKWYVHSICLGTAPADLYDTFMYRAPGVTEFVPQNGERALYSASRYWRERKKLEDKRDMKIMTGEDERREEDLKNALKYKTYFMWLDWRDGLERDDSPPLLVIELTNKPSGAPYWCRE